MRLTFGLAKNEVSCENGRENCAFAHRDEALPPSGVGQQAATPPLVHTAPLQPNQKPTANSKNRLVCSSPRSQTQRSLPGRRPPDADHGSNSIFRAELIGLILVSWRREPGRVVRIACGDVERLMRPQQLAVTISDQETLSCPAPSFPHQVPHLLTTLDTPLPPVLH